MPIIRSEIKAKIKAKIAEIRLKEDDTDSEEFFAELLLILLDEIKSTATITGVCPPNGGALVGGKIT